MQVSSNLMFPYRPPQEGSGTTAPGTPEKQGAEASFTAGQKRKPSTPEAHRYPTLPSRPKKVRRVTSLLAPFNATQVISPPKDSSFPFTPACSSSLLGRPPQNLTIANIYSSVSGHIELCIKQPSQDQSCGTAAVLMMLSHLIMNNQSKIELGELFWSWYSTQGLSHVKTLIDVLHQKTNIRELGLEAKCQYYQNQENMAFVHKDEGIEYVTIHNFREDLLNKIDSLIIKTKCSVVVSVTNRILEGHWIVVDGIDHQSHKVSIRDPYSGNGYHISFDELYENWNEEDETSDEVKCLYIEKSTSALSNLNCRV